MKTRIAATAGPVRAAEIYRELVAKVCARLPHATSVIVYFDPMERRAEIEAWMAKDAAIGPTEDGGYYLLALRRGQPALFETIRWSTSDTLACADAAGVKILRLPVLRDVDTESDWVRISMGS